MLTAETRLFWPPVLAAQPEPFHDGMQVPPFSIVAMDPMFVDVRGAGNEVSVATNMDTISLAKYTGSAATTASSTVLTIQTDSAGKHSASVLDHP